MAFVKVENNQKYLKTVIFGDTGTGKTTLGERIAIGLCENSKTKKVLVVDTEGGIDFFAKNFEEQGINCFTTDKKIDTTKVFVENLNIAISLRPDVILVDSITHVGELYQQEYVNSKPAKESLVNWGIAKRMWNLEVAVPLKEAKCHIIICGRETSGMNIEKKEVNGQTKTTIDYSNPTKVRAGFDIDFELNLLINTETAKVEGKQVRIARILKDRSNKIDGQEFQNATFEDIKPHLEGLAKKNEIYENLLNEIITCSDRDFAISLNSQIKENKNNVSAKEFSDLVEKWKQEAKEKDFKITKEELEGGDN